MSAQEMWEARTGAGTAESPARVQGAGDSVEVHSGGSRQEKAAVGHPDGNTTSRDVSSGQKWAIPRRVNPNDGRFIRAVVWGMAVAGFVAFSISFAALYEVAAWLGLPPFMYWAVPVFIDLAILVYAGSVLVHESRGESARASWWALGAFTVLSMVANGAHAWSAETAGVWQSLVGVLIAVMVPVAVFVATDQLARVAVETPDSRRAEHVNQVAEEADQMRAQAELERQRAELEAELEASRRQIEAQRREAEREAEVAEARHRKELERLTSMEATSASAGEESVGEGGAEGREVVSLVARDQPAVEPVSGSGSKASGAEVTAWIVEQAESGQVPSAAEVAERFGCSERTGRRRLADARQAQPEAFGADEEDQA